tara:strand:- start:5744 stop:6190 length:447 start_codon:yes stop_codon:yes gene_type:complete
MAEKKKIGAPKGNNNSLKWKTPDARQKAFDEVCKHLEAGYSKMSFPLADWDTVEWYCKKYPVDFPTERLKEAMRKHLLKWESIGVNGVKGEITGFNATAWIFNMKNRFRADWNDTVKNELSGPDGGAIVQKIERVIVDPREDANGQTG